ncbi:MAG: ATP-binding protein [Gemmatimonadales bacterium]|nr:ATP-binding protein [Gemmatimonadales bacterium]
MIARPAHVAELVRKLDANPVVALLGARQVGKTTLAGMLASTLAETQRPVTSFDLEDPRDLARLDEPTLALEPLRGLVIIDEIQRRPDLFPVLRVLADRRPRPARFLVLGSASPELLRQGSESLAGRISFHELGGLDLAEVGPERWRRLWLRGGFPRAWLARNNEASAEWRRDFIRTFVERDLPSLGISLPPRLLHDFWTMLAHYHGQIWNGAELGRAFGIAHTTVRRHLDRMTGAYVMRQLRPWRENLGKRVVKSPKVYIADSGLLHALLDIPTARDLAAHPKVGASWEGFALEKVVRRLGARPEECYFWAVHGGPELDLLVVRGRRRRGYEFKRTDAPRATASMHAAMRHLGLDQLDVVHVGNDTFPLTDGVRAVGGGDIFTAVAPL